MNTNKIKNIVYLISFTSILLVIKFFIIDRIFPNIEKDAEVWFTSGLLLIVLGTFVTEKYFTKPMDVIVNVITLFVVLFTITNTENFLLYWPLITYSLIISCIAFLSFILIDEKKDINFISQKIAHSSNIISGFLGSSKMLFSIVFILSLFSYFVSSIQNSNLINKEQVSIIILIIFWGIIILIEPIDKKLIKPLLDKINSKTKPSLVGKIIRRLSPGIIYVEQFSGSPKLNQGDLVIVNDIKNCSSGGYYAMYISELEADDKKYLQFYCFDFLDANFSNHMYVFKYDSEIPDSITNINVYKNRKDIIGFVYVNSDIDVIKVKMIDGVDEKKNLKEGDLVSVDFYNNSTKYQIINVEIELENVDGQNKKGVKIITAQQIGFWKNDKQKFNDTSWTPDLNTPVFLEDSHDDIPELEGNYFRVGLVPRSKYPIYVDLDECVTHHIAVIGKTGTGKSRMAAKIIEKMAQNDYKIVVLEVDRSNAQSLSKYIDNSLIEEQNSNTFNLDSSTKNIISIAIQIGNTDKKDGGVVNLSDMAASLIDKVILYQTKNQDKKICVVMEEAYDFIPENSFGKQEYGQPHVSRISQQVLKCRKHNIGFLIITQRTALVTKTILYQCHTIIALQSFDETSKNFMGAYINGRYLESMSILPRFRAIVVGKGSTCDKPVIVDFYDNNLNNAKEDKVLLTHINLIGTEMLEDNK